MSTVHKETDNYVIICDDSFNKSENTLFCNVCNYILKTHDDVITNDIYSSCHDCFLRFGEARKEEWLKGWRPRKEEIEKIRIEKDRIIIN